MSNTESGGAATPAPPSGRLLDARFAKPIDALALARELAEAPFVVTLEEGTAAGGFGSAALETAASHGADVSRLHVLGIPNRAADGIGQQ